MSIHFYFAWHIPNRRAVNANRGGRCGQPELSAQPARDTTHPTAPAPSKEKDPLSNPRCGRTGSPGPPFTRFTALWRSPPARQPFHRDCQRVRTGPGPGSPPGAVRASPGCVPAERGPLHLSQRPSAAGIVGAIRDPVDPPPLPRPVLLIEAIPPVCNGVATHVLALGRKLPSVLSASPFLEAPPNFLVPHNKNLKCKGVKTNKHRFKNTSRIAVAAERAGLEALSASPTANDRRLWDYQALAQPVSAILQLPQLKICQCCILGRCVLNPFTL